MGGSDEALQREVLELRARVAELQRAAARHEDTAGISLAEREELLREAERIAHLGTWTWDIQSGRVTWSDELFRIFGLEPGSLSPSTDAFVGHIHVDDRPRAEQATKQGLRDGVFPLFDYRIVRPDGSLRQATIYGSCLFDAEGNPRRVVGVVMDRTQGYAVEAEQRRTLSLLEEAQRSAQLGSWRFVPETNETEWSLEFRRIAGLPLDMTPHVRRFSSAFTPKIERRFRLATRRRWPTPWAARSMAGCCYRAARCGTCACAVPSRRRQMVNASCAEPCSTSPNKCACAKNARTRRRWRRWAA